MAPALIETLRGGTGLFWVVPVSVLAVLAPCSLLALADARGDIVVPAEEAAKPDLELRTQRGKIKNILAAGFSPALRGI